MNDAMAIYTSDLRVLIPTVAMFVIVFAIILRSMKEMSLIEGSVQKVAVSLCVSLLAIWGMDQALIRPLLLNYTAMGIAMLVSLAVMLLSVWIGLLVKTHRKNRLR
ncbi:MAG: hypothetical protein AB1724_12825 [Thermodesulfobacteriota bacterium]